MVHAKTDSEVTSLAASSPARSPRRPVYYVQSPSRDSHDGEKTATSLHSTPILSPTASPPHTTTSSLGHSRESSASRFSGALKPGSRKLPRSAAARGNRGAGGAGDADGDHKPWSHFDMIEEEGLLAGDTDSSPPLPRRCYIPAFLASFILLFSLFSLILWAASRPQKPEISITTISFHQFSIQAGSDFSGVATELLSLNSTVKLKFKNRGTFFGVHVTSTPVDLSYYQLTLGSGAMRKFYQSRKSQRSVSVRVSGKRIPLYGGGANWGTSSSGSTPSTVPLILRMTVEAKAYVLGKLVKQKFYRRIECSVNLHTGKLNTPISLLNSCSYS